MSEGRKNATKVAGLVAIFLVVAFGLFMIERVLDDAAEFHSWMQMLAGSSWPAWESVHDRHSWPFVLGAAWHFSLNFAPVVAIAYVVWELVLLRRRSAMELGDVLKLRDQTIKDALFKELAKAHPDAVAPDKIESFAASVDRAFDDGATWRAQNQLAKIVGGRFAQQLLKQTVQSK